MNLKNSVLLHVQFRKMRKRYVIAVITAITLFLWVHWSSKVELVNTITFLKQNSDFVKRVLNQPQNKSCQRGPLLVIIITSYVGHVELRSAHRRAMPVQLLNSMNATRVFLLAKIPDNERFITQEAVNNENNMFGDILQGSFVENYRNLTYKHLMGLQWASTSCSKASFILKVDDDIVFNLEKTVDFLTTLNSTENLLMGYILNNTKPSRNKQTKWYVTFDEYQINNYPPYLSGWYYITTPKVAAEICDEAIYHPYFWIDDIFVTGLVTEALGRQLRQLPNDYWLEYYELLECCLTDMIKKYIKCDYVVGPNGGRHNLILEFNEAIKNCKEPKCTKRQTNELLNKNCVVFRNRNIFSAGKPEIPYYVKL